MKRLNWIILTVGLCGIYACQNDIGFDNSFNPEPTGNSVPANHLAFIEEMGFDITDLRDRGDYYLVEGDILLKKKIIDSISNSETRHRYNPSRGFVSTENQTIKWYGNLSVGYSPSFNDAVKEWNALEDCNIEFVYVNNKSQADVIVYQIEDKYLAETLNVVFPFNGKPGERIDMNIKGVNLPDPIKEKDKLKYMFMHALGHVVGFAHTPRDSKDDIDRNTSAITNTVTYDPSSIMTKDTYPHSWSGFSQNDKEAFARVYPHPGWDNIAPVITGPTELLAGHSYVYSASIDNPVSNMKHYWTITNGQILKWGEKATLRFNQTPQPRTVVIDCMITNSDNTESSNRGIKRVTVNPVPISLTDNIVIDPSMSQTIYVNWDIENPLDYTYNWEIPDGLNAQPEIQTEFNRQVLRILPNSAPGQYEIKLQLKSKIFNQEAGIVTSNVTVSPPAIIPDVTLVHGQWTTVELDWDIPNKDDYTYSWTFDPFLEYRIVSDTKVEVRSFVDREHLFILWLDVRGKENNYNRRIKPDNISYIKDQQKVGLLIAVQDNSFSQMKFKYADSQPIDGYGIVTTHYEYPIGENRFYFEYELRTPSGSKFEKFEFTTSIYELGAKLNIWIDMDGELYIVLYEDKLNEDHGNYPNFWWEKGFPRP